MKRLVDGGENFISFFNPQNGFYIRSGVLDEKGCDTGVDPFMASFPQLIDVGIMGHCVHGASGLCLQSGVQCYQNGPYIKEPNMNLFAFKRIIDECKDKTFQVALGGRGDPDIHEDFENILRYSAINGVVPNFTTSGFGLTQEKAALCKKYCGAVAVSWYRHRYTFNAIRLLLEEGVKTNIHYVLASNSVQEAIWLLKNNGFPEGINAVVFLLHKPVGLGEKHNILSISDRNAAVFFKLIDKERFKFKIGFDSCTVPALIHYKLTLNHCFIDTCEGARFSCYISPDLQMVPCSFDQEYRYAFDLNGSNIQHGWRSEPFELFRNILRESCPECIERDSCMGGCPLEREVVLCEKRNN